MFDVTHVRGYSPQIIIASDTLYTGNSEAFFATVNALLVREHPPKRTLILFLGGSGGGTRRLSSTPQAPGPLKAPRWEKALCADS